MKYEKVVDMDLNNGDGIGVTLWVTGCPHHCYGCHNKILWDENRGKEDYIEAVCDVKVNWIKTGSGPGHPRGRGKLKLPG